MRVERDFLGEVELPDQVYYGVQTMRAVQNFPITGHKLDKEFIIALAIVKKAAAKANMKTGRMPTHIGAAIVEAAVEIMAGKWHEQFVVDAIQGGAGTSMNMNTNEVIANRALEILGRQKGDYEYLSPNNHVNMAQSTNDVIPTAIRIASIRKATRLYNELVLLAESLNRKADEFSQVLKMGRTHLQDAVPITLGQEFAAYAAGVKRAAKRVQRAMQFLLAINMGATAVGTGLNAEPEYIEEVVRQICWLTDEHFISAPNLVDATQNTDELAEFSSTLKICALSLSKMANDLRLMASGPKCGFNEITLPAMQPGSSIMPGKVNPVIPEMVNQVAFQVVGNDQAISLAVEAGQFELNVMEPVIAYNLFNSLTILTNAVIILNNRCIMNIVANDSRCQQMVDDSIGVITALLPHIGYETASLIAKEAIASSRPVKEIIKAKDLIASDRLEIILAPGEMTKPGIAGKQYLSSTKEDIA
ncbi:aspartate ammonia-lyase [Sporomusa acidovorans]|uniref:Aspartate ammonia-lyase n=1 Tax=Sporomusa acidovorans (strain ATCC 49682 / DSM 3132 / Mol) TaxID=1123286 RepID=A0ABZ3J132_SPOA4|nr:aspartate ammonia-lyase [Sporomusa acidovorans]OZC22801.1 aspartate ammonia-lyase [Sporomusa acidovorans DSM 3132]SDE51380.1 aspartate ammonia-lyase [Sporomusa acidovorans]